ncbi:hypothetical protein ACJMK2_029183 [Sinanodonta woodiana]|uniref:Uncharacterized protein n=1 Tax=Sinanodonta woodiana TaxID=1069815 RepID=A0ABD3XBD4_SINWO
MFLYDLFSRLDYCIVCPNSTILQQLPVQNFLSLMESVIKSSINTTTKRKEKLSLEENIHHEIPEDVLNRLRLGDEMVVRRFVDTGLARHQPSDRRENRDIRSIYFPSVCRLFIYIPTENGNYWHHLDMRREPIGYVDIVDK